MADDPIERLKLVHNERVKLEATYTNGLAIAIFAVGGLTIPLNSVAQGNFTTGVSAIAALCVIASIALHTTAWVVLRGLR